MLIFFNLTTQAHTSFKQVKIQGKTLKWTITTAWNQLIQNWIHMGQTEMGPNMTLQEQWTFMRTECLLFCPLLTLHKNTD